MASSARWIEAAADVYACTALVPLDCPRDVGPEGRFTLHEVVGLSDRSWVYRATDNRLSDAHFSATVALKLTRGSKRGRTEALLSRAVEHPHAVRVIDCGTLEEGFEYVVTEWMEGGNLGQRQSPFSLRAATILTIQVAGAVQAAHARGIVHCDIKPDNVLLDRSGVPKLADFDLAFFSPLDDGSWRGTPAFMPPEQLLNEPGALSPQADVYGLGALLYWCFTGKPPHGEDEDRLRAAATQKLLPNVEAFPSRFRRILLKALAPTRDSRYQTVFEFASDLQAWLDHRPIPWQQTSMFARLGLLFKRHPAKSVASIAISVALVGGGLSAWWLHEREQTRQREANEREVLRQREADAKSVAMAQEAVDKTKARLRSLVKANFSTLRQQKTDSIEQFGPALVFAEWLGTAAVFGPGDEPVEVEGRVELLERLIAEAKSKGHDSGIAVLATRLALLDVFMQSRKYSEALSLLDTIRKSHAGLLAQDPTTSRWIRANELAARLGVDGEAKLIGSARDELSAELAEIIKGLDGPYFSRAQRRQIEAQR